MKRIVATTLTGLALFIALIFWALFLSPRPLLTIDPATLAGDGSQVNYCELPLLDGSGLMAKDIPKGNTPGCGYKHFPLPILAQCTEPLTDGADDIRGLWQEIGGDHVERVEQCGRRVVITTSDIIHDFGPNSTLGETTNDTEGVAFRIAGKPFCPRTSASMVWQDGTLNFHAFGFGPVVVKRFLEDENLVWEYLNGSITRMKRICTLPASKKYPERARITD
ncbi:MAG: hypothetical protein V7459_08875 [Oceanicoccus sp.]